MKDVATAPPDGNTDVYLDGRKVGRLQRTGPRSQFVTFTYDESILHDPTAAVSVRLPVRAAPYEDQDAVPCFENLLPDGDLRDLLAAETHQHRGDVVGLLGVFGGECAGALSLWANGTLPPAVPAYRRCGREEIHAAFDPAGFARPGDAGSRYIVPSALADPLAISGSPPGTSRAHVWKSDEAGGAVGEELTHLLRAGRLSMSGAQEKLVLYRRPPVDDISTSTAAEYHLPVNGAPSTVLVKRERGRFPGLLQNEIAAMALMAAAGVPTASHTICSLDDRVYETARFDRLCDTDGYVRRLHAEDGCQFTGRRSTAKYGQRGGPTYTELRTALRRYSADPLTDAEWLFRWAVANLALGNRDAHAKNVSLLYHTPLMRRLAPAYDVVCTMAYRNLDAVLPLSFGGQYALEAITPTVMPKVAREFGVTVARARELAADVCDRIDNGRSDALHLAESRAGAHAVLGVMDGVIQSMTTATRRALLGELAPIRE